VHGVARSETKAKQLAADEGTFPFPLVPRDEVTQLISTLQSPPPTDAQARTHPIPTIDVVIEAPGGSVVLPSYRLTHVSFVYTSGG
jgi:hypothetical protein